MRLLKLPLICVLISSCRDSGSAGGKEAGLSAPTTAASPIGRLWHDNFGLDSVRGLQLSSLEGDRTRLIDQAETAVPTPDALHFVVFEYESSTRVSTVTVRETATRAIVSRATFDGYVHRIKPSPRRLGEMLVTWADCAGCATAGNGRFTFLDLPNRKVLAQFSEVDAAASWLPDGRYLHHDSQGRIFVGTTDLTIAQTQIGVLAVAGRKLRGLWVDPTGRQMITRWVRNAGGGATDLWMSSVDGSNAQQLTATGLTTYGLWSPDGAHFAFDHDTDSGCRTSGCSSVPTGRCDLYFASSSDRNISLSSDSVGQFTVLDSTGRRKTLGCNLRSWTR